MLPSQREWTELTAPLSPRITSKETTERYDHDRTIYSCHKSSPHVKEGGKVFCKKDYLLKERSAQGQGHARSEVVNGSK